MDICGVFELFGKGKARSVERIKDPEDGTYYSVWRVAADGANYVVKKAKGKELSVYRAFFPRPTPGVPRCLGSVSACGDDYLLLSCERGEGLLRLDCGTVRAAINTLVGIQERFWCDVSHSADGITFEESFSSRAKRGKYLGDETLEKCYARFLELYPRLPRTLCHDDLLPYNVLYDGERAVIVDWEHAGILPYPTSFARLIAHCREGENELFRMTDEDKEFAKAYYYERFVKEKGIDEREYRRALDYFIFYEYCEWVMLGNKYPDADMQRYREYLSLARSLASRLSEHDEK